MEPEGKALRQYVIPLPTVSLTFLEGCHCTVSLPVAPGFSDIATTKCPTGLDAMWACSRPRVYTLFTYEQADTYSYCMPQVPPGVCHLAVHHRLPVVWHPVKGHSKNFMLSAIPSSSILPLSSLAPLPRGRGVLTRAQLQGPLIAMLLRSHAVACRSSCLHFNTPHM